jgi:acetyl-CoA carboxylase carboxyl transferase subunit alpha
MPVHLLPFEKPIAEMENKLAELRRFSESQDIDVSAEIRLMEEKIAEMRRRIFAELTPWQIVQLARHPQRPYTRDYLQHWKADFLELHGDRLYADDAAIVGGLARLGDRRVMLIGTQKGRDMRSNVQCNFGCAYPDGYRKALRLMRLADRFDLPIVTLIDTPGAYPGVQSEERHIAEAIAVNLREMFRFRVPIIVSVTGEGGSGGALGIGVGDRVLILQYAYYSVISPEGCAAILWKDRAHADRAAQALKLTAPDLLAAGMVDEVIPEPEGGAHRDPARMAEDLQAAILRHLRALEDGSPTDRLAARYEKFRRLGVYQEEPPPPSPPADDTARHDSA